MANLNMITPLSVQGLINRFCYTIGMLPTSYKESLTYEEQILAIGKYLEDTVYPAINNNAQALKELQELFTALQIYVENYFEHLDVQTEIDNKLDEMVEDGTFDKIINQELFTQLNNRIEELGIELSNDISDLDTKLDNDVAEINEDITDLNNVQKTQAEIIQSQTNRINSQDIAIQAQFALLGSLSSSTPKGTYSTLAALQSANPETGVYIVTENNHIYSWTHNGSAVDLGVYQATQLGDNAINYSNLDQNLKYSAEDTNIVDNIAHGIEYEIGNVTLSQNPPVYSSINSRVRMKEGTTIHLKPGDKITLTSYANARFYIGWQRDIDNLWKFGQQWFTQDFTVTEQGKYIILVSNLTETNLNGNMYLLTNLIKIYRYKNDTDLYKNLEEIIDKGINEKYIKDLIGNFTIDWNAIGCFYKYPKRLAMHRPLVAPTDLKISVASGYQVGVQLWDTTETLQQSDQLSDTGYGQSWTVNKGSIFTFVVKRDDNADIAIEEKANITIQKAPASAAHLGQVKIGAGINVATDGTISVAGTELYDKLNYNFDKTTIKSVNHRGYNTIAPENTLPAFKLSKVNGFNTIETDIRLTSDNVCVLLHDATINRTSNGSGNVHDMTYAQLLNYDFGSWKSQEYAGTKIPTFEQLLILCRNINLSAYIEIEPDAGFNQSIINSLVTMVERYGLEEKITFISFSKTMLGYVKTANPHLRLGLLYSQVGSFVNDVAELKTTTNEVFVDLDYTIITNEICTLLAQNDIKLECWTVDSEETIENMNAYVDGFTSNNKIAEQVLYNANID